MNSPGTVCRSLPIVADRCRSFSLIAALFLVACSPAPDSAQPPLPAIPVQTERVNWSSDAIPIPVSGIASRENEAPLSFKVGGVIESIQVRPGDSVRRGDCLAALRLEEIDNQVKQAASQLDKTRRDLQRMSALFTKQVVTIEEKQNAETALEIAEAALRTARFNREYAVILAPDDGLILQRWAEPGEVTTAGRAILSFAANGNRWLFNAGLSEQSAGRLAIGDPATVTFRNGDRLSGRVARLAGATDPQTRLVKIEIELERPAREIRSGYLASALIQPQAVSPRPRVPLAALVEGKDRIAALFVVDSGKARRLRVEVEALSDQYAYLRTPLEPGTEIVVSGAERVSDGIPLEVVPAAAVAQNVNGGRRSVGAGTDEAVPSMGETVTGSVP